MMLVSQTMNTSPRFSKKQTSCLGDHGKQTNTGISTKYASCLASICLTNRISVSSSSIGVWSKFVHCGAWLHIYSSNSTSKGKPHFLLTKYHGLIILSTASLKISLVSKNTFTMNSSLLLIWRKTLLIDTNTSKYTYQYFRKRILMYLITHIFNNTIFSINSSFWTVFTNYLKTSLK